MIILLVQLPPLLSPRLSSLATTSGGKRSNSASHLTVDDLHKSYELTE